MDVQVQSKFRSVYPLLMASREDHSFFRYAPGWLPLVYELFGLLDDEQQRTGQGVGIGEVKEKFGGLRLHMSVPSMSSSEQRILEAVFGAFSTRICDLCGEPGSLGRFEGFWSTKCEKHKEIKHQQQYDRLERQALERFAGYERQGIVTKDIVFVDARRSRKVEGGCCLSLYGLPDRLDNLRESSFMELLDDQDMDGTPEKMRSVVQTLRERRKRIIGVTDCSEPAQYVFEREAS